MPSSEGGSHGLSQRPVAVYTLRVERPLLDAARSIAERERRSLNSQICIWLEELVNADQELVA